METVRRHSPPSPGLGQDPVPGRTPCQLRSRSLARPPTPLPPEDEDGPGILKWKLDIPAGGEQVTDLRFSVTAPWELAEQQLQELECLY